MSKPGSGRWVLPVNPRIAALPAPAVSHITSGALYLLAGILQFSAAFRRRCPRGHVRAGRLLAVLGPSTWPWSST
jgi:hypothetical protein